MRRLVERLARTLGRHPGRAPSPARGGRVLALALVLTSFLRAGAAPPCDAHHHAGNQYPRGAPAATATEPRHHTDHAPAGGHGGDSSGCSCIGACHPAAAAALANAPSSIATAAVLLVPITGRPADRPTVARTDRAHVLPYATAPPEREV